MTVLFLVVPLLLIVLTLVLMLLVLTAMLVAGVAPQMDLGTSNCVTRDDPIQPPSTEQLRIQSTAASYARTYAPQGSHRILEIGPIL